MSRHSRIAGFTVDSNGHYSTRRPLTPEQIIEAGRALTKQLYFNKDLNPVTDPDIGKRVFQAELEGEEREVFAAMFLDNRHRPLALERLFFRTVDGATVYPREILKRALSLNAAALLVAHNHTSGDPTPSRADIALTKGLKQVLGVVDIRLLDHFVVGMGAVTSLVELGHL